MAHARLAQGNQGAVESPLAAVAWASPTGSRNGSATRACSICQATKFGSSASGARPASRSTIWLICRRKLASRCRDDQGVLGLRAGSPAAQGRARPRPLRRPLMARSSSPCADGHDRLRLSPASSPHRRERGKKNLRWSLNLCCRPSEKPSSPPWPALGPTDAHTAAGNPQTTLLKVPK